MTFKEKNGKGSNVFTGKLKPAALYQPKPFKTFHERTDVRADLNE